MATLTLFLDVRKKPYSVKLRISHAGKQKMLSMGFSLEEEQWNKGVVPSSDGTGPVVKAKNASSLNKLLNSRIVLAESALLDLKMKNESFTFDEMYSEILKRIDPAREAKDSLDAKRSKLEKTSFLTVYRKWLSLKDGRTWELYNETLKKIRAFINREDSDCYLLQMQFEEIDLRWIERFDRWLSSTCGTNTRGIHLRNLRAVCHYAWQYEYTTRYVWGRYSIKKEETDHRDLTDKEIQILFAYPMPGEDWIQEYRDICLLSLYLGGINLIDLHALTESNIRDGYIHYRRAKTGRWYQIPIFAEAQEIIDKYKGEGHLLRFGDKNKDHKSFMKHINTHFIKKVGPVEYVARKNFNPSKVSVYGQYKKIFHPLLNSDVSYYCIRHTVGTLAANRCRCSKDDVAALLGHGKKTVTDTYIRPDQSRVDNTLRKVIDEVSKIISKAKF